MNIELSSGSNFVAELEEARQGSPETRAELLNRFRDYLRTIATSRLRDEIQGQMSVSDIVQSAIIDAEKGFDHCRAQNRAEFKAWLRRILLNDILNKYRDLRRQKRDVRRERPISSNLPVVEDGDSPSQRVVNDEEQQRLMKAIKTLSPDHQQVIHLRHRDGLKFGDISKKMNRTPDAARMLWNRAIELLAKALREEI